MILVIGGVIVAIGVAGFVLMMRIAARGGTSDRDASDDGAGPGR